MPRDREEKEEVFCFENLGYRHGLGTHPMVTVKIERWFYYIPRAKLTLIDGIYGSPEEVDEAVRKAELLQLKAKVQGQGMQQVHEKPPRFFEVVCHPQSLLHLAEAIRRVCSRNEE